MEETIKEKKIGLLNNSVIFFIFLTFVTIILSFIGSMFNWQGTYIRINPITGALERNIVAIENMISGEGIRYIIGNAISNFVSFAPLGMMVISLIGIGIAYKSGLFAVLFPLVGKRMNKITITFSIALLGILSSFGGEIGYVVLIPLAALFFLFNNRNPVIGIIVAFISVSAGYGMNILVTALDYNLLTHTQLAASLIDSNINITMFSDIFFSIIGTFILAFFIAHLTEKVIVSRIPKYKHGDDLIIDEVMITKKEKRGLLLAALGIFILAVIYIYMITPGLPLSGVLLDSLEPTYVGKLFGSASYFNHSLIYVLSIIFMVSGLLYGIGARTIKSSYDFSKMIFEGINNIGPILILIFIASQFISILRKTNLGSVITIRLVDLISFLNFTSISLMVLFILLVAIANIFLPSSISKWAIMSPVVVPLFMKSNLTPEFTQLAFKLGESITNIITPSLAYFIVFIGFIEIYSKGEQLMPIKKIYRTLLIYSLGISLLWLFIIITWYIIGLPIGINVFPTV